MDDIAYVKNAETKKIKVSGGICSRFEILKRLKAFQGGRLWIRPQAFRKKAFRQALAGYKFAPCLLLQAAARRAYWIINQLSDFQEESPGKSALLSCGVSIRIINQAASAESFLFSERHGRKSGGQSFPGRKAFQSLKLIKKTQ